MQYVRTTDAAVEPVTATEMKAHLRVDHSDEDTLISSLITAARQIAEDYCERSFITQTWKAYLQDFPVQCIKLPRGKVISIVAVKYAVSAAHDTTLAASGYHTALETDIAILEPNDEWPDNDDEFPNSVEIEYTAGYGATAGSVPQAIKNAILLIGSDLYEHRKSTIDKTNNIVGYMGKPAWQFMLDPYKIYIHV